MRVHVFLAKPMRSSVNSLIVTNHGTKDQSSVLPPPPPATLCLPHVSLSLSFVLSLSLSLSLFLFLSRRAREQGREAGGGAGAREKARLAKQTGARKRRRSAGFFGRHAWGVRPRDPGPVRPPVPRRSRSNEGLHGSGCTRVHAAVSVKL